MSATVTVPTVVVARAAAAIANARGRRRGAPPVDGILTALPQKLFDEVMEDARVALEAASFADLLAILKRAWEEAIEPEVPLDSIVDCAWCGLTGAHTKECLLPVMAATIQTVEQPS